MLKLRLTLGGRKGQPSYRVVLIKSESRRDGRPLENLGYYSPLTKKFFIDIDKVKIRLSQGAKPSKTLNNLLIKAGVISS